MSLVLFACEDSHSLPPPFSSPSSPKLLLSSLSRDVIPLSLPSLLSLVFHFNEKVDHLETNCPSFPKEVIAHSFSNLEKLTSRPLYAGNSIRNLLLLIEERERVGRGKEREEERGRESYFSDLTSPLEWTVSVAVFLIKLTFSAYSSVRDICHRKGCLTIGCGGVDVKWTTRDKMESVTAEEYVKRSGEWIASQVTAFFLTHIVCHVLTFTCFPFSQLQNTRHFPVDGSYSDGNRSVLRRIYQVVHDHKIFSLLGERWPSYLAMFWFVFISAFILDYAARIRRTHKAKRTENDWGKSSAYSSLLSSCSHFFALSISTLLLSSYSLSSLLFPLSFRYFSFSSFLISSWFLSTNTVFPCSNRKSWHTGWCFNAMWRTDLFANIRLLLSTLWTCKLHRGRLSSTYRFWDNSPQIHISIWQTCHRVKILSPFSHFNFLRTFVLSFALSFSESTHRNNRAMTENRDSDSFTSPLWVATKKGYRPIIDLLLQKITRRPNYDRLEVNILLLAACRGSLYHILSLFSLTRAQPTTLIELDFILNGKGTQILPILMDDLAFFGQLTLVICRSSDLYLNMEEIYRALIEAGGLAYTPLAYKLKLRM